MRRPTSPCSRATSRTTRSSDEIIAGLAAASRHCRRRKRHDRAAAFTASRSSCRSRSARAATTSSSAAACSRRSARASRRCAPARKVAIVTDETVAQHHLAGGRGRAEGRRHRQSRASSCRPAKARRIIATFETVCEALIAARIERGDLVVALGGGVIGDLAGFAAASVRRGLDFVQVPTTLLAQVDSSVGGKTGINSRHGKNLIGAFHQPILVLADTALLDTLPTARIRRRLCRGRQVRPARRRRFLRVAGSQLAGRLLPAAPAREHAIAVCCRAKAGIVARDERETGERALLNLGHTFGHALEAAAGFSGRLLHGEAVALGMVLAFEFSAQHGSYPAADARARHARILRRSACQPISSDVPGGMPAVDALMDLIAQDKKVKRGKLTFILVRGIGQAFVARMLMPRTCAPFLPRKSSPNDDHDRLAFS